MPASPSLRELQQGFVAAMLGDSCGVTAWVVGAGLEPQARLRIYQHAIAANLSDALRTSYPGVLALVGEDFFEAMASRYRRQHPSTSGNLQHFGHALAEFMADMPEASQLRYLPDMARLEWCRQLTALAADASTVDATRCAEVAVTAPEQLHIRLHPSVRLLRSDYAVLSLWQWCKLPTDTAPRVEPGEQLMLWRDEGEVAMAALEPATFRCIEMLAGGHDLASAWISAREVDDTFDLESCLRDLLGHGLVVAFTGEETP